MSAIKGHPGLYRPEYIDKDGIRRESAIIWMRFNCRGCLDHPNGGKHRESSETEKITEAQRRLDAKRGKSADGFYADYNSVMLCDLLRAVEHDYVVKGNKSLPDIKDQLKNDLIPFFEGKHAIDLCRNDSLLRSFIATMKKDGKANATINRRLATIRRAFSLAKNRFPMRPNIEMLPERNARKIFFAEKEYLTLIKNLPDDIRRPIIVAWITGWRTPSEILTRLKHHVDWNSNRLILEPGETKNGEGRFFPLISELQEVLREQNEATKKIEKKKGMIIQYLFHHDGEPLASRNKRGTIKTSKYFSESWDSACAAAGLAGRIPHDFRRSAARRFRSEGYDLKIAMKLLGHKTASIYDRYDIITDEDILSEVKKHHDLKSGAKKGQSKKSKADR